MSLDYTKLIEISNKCVSCCTVQETMVKIGNAAKVKCHKTPKDAIFLSGLMAGMFIALGAYATLMTGRSWNIAISPTSNLKGVTVIVAGLQNLISAAVFPIGIIFVVWFGCDLYMGNTMVLSIGLITGKAKWYAVLKTFIISFLGNLAGSMIMAFFFTYLIQKRDNDNLLPWQLFCVKFCIKKCDMKFWELILSGIIGTWCVNLAVFVGVGSKAMIGKIFGVWYSIFTFVAIGVDNSIAGAYFVALGVWYGAGAKYWGLFWYYVAMVSIGNMIGGIFMITAYQTWMSKRRGEWNHLFDHLLDVFFVGIGIKKPKKDRDVNEEKKEKKDSQNGSEESESESESEDEKDSLNEADKQKTDMELKISPASLEKKKNRVVVDRIYEDFDNENSVLDTITAEN